MPYKFKDDGSHIIKQFQRKIYFIIGILITIRPIFNYILFRENDFLDWLGIPFGLLLIWGINKNGFYKIIRKITEWKMKNKDNKFDYFAR